MSFAITILKVLAGHPGGRLPLADLTRAVGILISSGQDWTNRANHLAARAPGLDLFGQSLVQRDADGWQITAAGRAFLTSIHTLTPPITESLAQGAVESEEHPIGVATPVPLPVMARPPLRLVHVNRRRHRNKRPSAVA